MSGCGRTNCTWLLLNGVVYNSVIMAPIEVREASEEARLKESYS